VDSASCLAFAPQHRRASDGKVTQRDWQTPSNTGDPDFIKLEPWAVPCDNQWMKDNYGKWEGYSFYRYESNVEKCVNLAFSLAVQPVMAFVGGIEFDLLPGPIAEVEQEVCWPDKQPGGVDLSLVSTMIRSAGIVLLKHTVRLRRRFGTDTAFTPANVKDSVERARNRFGKGTTDDDKGLNGLTRQASLAETDGIELGQAQPDATDVDDFVVEHEEFELASAEYDQEYGVKLLQRLTGSEAGQRLSKLMRSADSEPADGKLGAVQEDASAESETPLTHQLFVIHDAGGPVGFRLTGQLSQGKFQLKVRLEFGPFTTPERTIDLLNIGDMLQVVLAAIPFVSSTSKDRAIHAIQNMNMEDAVPVLEADGTPALVNGWRSYLYEYGEIQSHVRNGFCSVEGLVRSGSWGHIMTLPTECRPTKRLIFNMNNHEGTTRIDVFANGQVHFVAGSHSHGWVSLSGIIFCTSSSEHKALPLANNWRSYGGDYSTATFAVRDGFCTVEGLVKSGGWSLIATLPAECRPKKRLIFNLNNHERTSRVDVLADGSIHWMAGGNSHGWISLSGVAFGVASTRHKALAFANGWHAYGGDYGHMEYTLANGVCSVEALVKPGDWSQNIAFLPGECRPSKRLIFNLNVQSKTARVDVLPSGEIFWWAGAKDQGWLSLSGIHFAASKANFQQITLVNGWVPYGNVYRVPEYTAATGLCVLQGLLRSGSWGALAQLPAECRPTKQLIFNMNNHESQNRIDVTAEGDVKYVAGSKAHHWVSVAGAIFAPGTADHKPLPLVNGWQSYGYQYMVAEYVLRNAVCLVEGLVKSGSWSWSHIATLPGECRPTKRLIFNMNNQEGTSRIDVYPNGAIHWIAGARSHGWVSLSGIVFAPGAANRQTLQLVNGWSSYGGEYATAEVVIRDGLCILEGLINHGSAGSRGHMATLPAKCLPNKRLIFNMNQHTVSARVDVYENGQVHWVAGGGSSNWVSLAGIAVPVS